MGSYEPFTDDSPISAVGQNLANARLYRGIGLNTIRALQDRSVDFSSDGGEIGDSYVDSDGRMNSVDTYFAKFNSNKMGIPPYDDNLVYVEFDATSISNEGRFRQNGCYIVKTSDTSYVCISNSGTSLEENRARLYATLFAGERGSGTSHSSNNPAILELIGNTYLKTSITRDVGGRFWRATHASNCDDNETTYYKFTANATTGNESQSCWYDQTLGRYSTTHAKNGSLGILNSVNEHGAHYNYIDYANTIGYDKSAKEEDNPTSAYIGFSNNDCGSSGTMLLLTKVDGAWAYSRANNGTVNSHSETLVDYKTDHNVPDLTLSNSFPSFYSEIIHDIPLRVVGKNYSETTVYSTTNTTYTTIINRSGINEFINKITVDIKSSNTVYTSVQATFTYSDSTTATVNVSNKGTSYVTKNVVNPYYSKTVSSILVEMKIESSGYTAYCKNYTELKAELLFSSTLKTAFLTTLVEDWEDGANIQYKLTNTTEDTGWLDYNEVSTFTAFTSEPTKCIVKLIPKTTNPIAGYPSIKGFYLRGWD